MDTGLNHLAHHLIFGLVTFPFEFSGGNVAVLNRLFDQLKRDGNGAPVAVVQRVEQVTERIAGAVLLTKTS